MRQPRTAGGARAASLSGVAIVAMLARYHPGHTTHPAMTGGSWLIGLVIFVAIFGFSWFVRNRRRS